MIDTAQVAQWYSGGMYLMLSILVMLASFGVQAYLKNVYGRWSQVTNGSGLTGAEVARRMLDEEGLSYIPVQMSEGFLSDHYDPIRKTVNLSEHNFTQPSVAAIAVAAHEVGHAIQDKVHMPALVLRAKLVAPLSLGSTIAPWLFLAGFGLQMTGLMWVGVIFFGLTLLFHTVTLPVEFDASRRALVYIQQRNLAGVDGQEAGARSVLTAAALTYVLAFTASLVELLRMLDLMRSRD